MIQVKVQKTITLAAALANAQLLVPHPVFDPNQ